MVQPSSPDSQRFTSSGLVNASNTIWRGAFITRVITSSRSPCAAIVNPPEFAMSLLLVLRSLVLTLWVVAFALHRLHLVEQCVEVLVPPFPELTIVLKPLRHFGQRFGLQLPRSSLRIATARDQTGPLQHLEVLRNGRLAHLKRLSQLQNRSLAERQPRQDRSPGWV